MARFDVEEFLEGSLGVVSTAEGAHGRELICDCPLCGKARKLWVNARSGAWICYRCGESGGTVKLVSAVEGIPYREALRVLTGRVVPRITTPVEETRRRVDGVRGPEADVDVLSLPEGFRPIYDEDSRRWQVPQYLHDRGIRLRTARLYRLGFCLSGRYEGRLILPAYQFGVLTFWQGRAMGSWEPKYLSPQVSRASVVWGLDEAIGSESVVVVEGPLDALGAHQSGVRAVALLGKVASWQQAIVLRRAGFRRVTVMLDGDAVSDAVAVAEVLGEAGIDVTIAVLPSGRDPGDATSEEINGAVRDARVPTVADRYGVKSC